MGFKLLVQPQAQEDISNTIHYYNSQRKGLGFEFFQELKDLTIQIRKYPELFSVKYAKTRVGLLKRFPYLIFIF